MSTTRELQKKIQTKQSQRRLHEGVLRARHPVVGPVLTAQHCRARWAFTIAHQNWQVHHCHPVLFTR